MSENEFYEVFFSMDIFNHFLLVVFLDPIMLEKESKQFRIELLYIIIILYHFKNKLIKKKLVTSLTN